MKKFFRKIFCLLLAFGIVSTVLTSCGSSTLDGRYVPKDSTLAAALPEITISGNNFTMKVPMVGTEVTAKFTYENEKFIFTEVGIPIPCEFKNGSLWYSGMQYKKIK